VDAAQYQRRMQDYDFDMASRALGAAPTPGDSLRVVYGSEAGKKPGSSNIAGIAHPAVDALIERIAQAKSREELNVACRAFDRVLRAGHYWVPMWYKASDWIAYWDMFSRPAAKPRFATGAPGSWWYDAEKARRIGRA
jgi:microcin C transport system substrate-binding protein